MKSEINADLSNSQLEEAGDGRSIESFLGKIVKEHRTNQGLTIADLAEQSGLSRSMVSKIENGQVSTSLDSIVSIARALGISISALFKNFEHREGNAQHVKAGKGMEVVRRGTTKGHTYHLLAYDQGPVKLFEPEVKLIRFDAPLTEAVPPTARSFRLLPLCWAMMVLLITALAMNGGLATSPRM